MTTSAMVHTPAMPSPTTTSDTLRSARLPPATVLSSVLLHLLGEPIVNRHGHKLGVVDDLLIDPASGRIAYGVMAWGGFMGRGERQLVLPWRALTRDAAQHAFVLDADEQRLGSAPCLDDGRWPAERTHEWHLAVHRHYETLPYWH